MRIKKYGRKSPVQVMALESQQFHVTCRGLYDINVEFQA